MGLIGRGYSVQSRRPMTARLAGAEVRFFFNQDERVATEIRDIAGRAVATAGYNIDVELRLMANPERTSGAVEVWLPSLSRALPSLGRGYKSKY